VDESLESLDRKLKEAFAALGGCGELIVELDLQPDPNVRKIGQVIVMLTEINQQVWNVRPDLTPDDARPDWGTPERPNSGADNPD